MGFFLRYLGYVRRHWAITTVSVVAGMLYVIFSGVAYWLAADFIQALFRGEMIVPPLPEGPIGPGNVVAFLKHRSAALLVGEGMLETLTRTIVILLAAFFLRNLALYIQATLSALVEQKVAKRMRDQLYRRLLEQDLAFYHVRKGGDIVSIAVNDITALNAGLAEGFSKLIRDPITILLFFLLLLAVSWKLTLAALLIAPISSVVVSLAGLSLKRRSKRAQERLGAVTAGLNEVLYGMRIVQAYGGEKWEQERFDRATDSHFRQALGRERLRRAIIPLSEVVGVVVISGVLLVAGGKVIGGEWLQPGDFVRFLVLLFGMLTPVVSLGEVQSHLKVAEGASRRVFDLLDAEHFIRENPRPVKVDGFRDAIRFERVSIRYSRDRPPALAEVSLEIRPRERVVLVGRSGSGKSTLLNLLPRFYDPTGGRITLDGIDLRDFSIRDLRSLFGVVTQEVVLFNDTVRANIAYNMDVDREQIIRAAKQAQAHEFILELPRGYDTSLGDLGDRLSGGQKQRISIARALLKDPPILLLDEPTSALDSDVAEEILATLEEVGSGRTVITATHRLSSISAAERVILLDEGRVIAEGTHDRLYDENELYRELCDRQFKM